MSLKGIELQIAIPKTFEAGKLSEQKQQQSQLNQDLANALVEREEIKKRESVLHAEKTKKADSKSKHQQSNDEGAKEQQKKDEKEKKMMHPYKGAFVDYSG